MVGVQGMAETKRVRKHGGGDQRWVKMENDADGHPG